MKRLQRRGDTYALLRRSAAGGPDGSRAVAALIALGEGAALLAAAAEGGQWMRWCVLARQIPAAGEAAVTAQLVRQLLNERADVRQTAVERLSQEGWHPSPDEAGLMFRILADDWTDLAPDALACLGRGRLLGLLPDLDVNTRRSVLAALNRLADSDNLAAPWEFMAEQLVARYGEIGRQDGFLTDPRREDVVALIGRLARRVDPQEELAPLVRWLVERLADRPRAVRLASGRALQAMARRPGCPAEVRQIILSQQPRMQEAHRDVISSPSCRKEGGGWYSFGGGEHTDQGIGLDPDF
ncbi:MAG: hypothetical protein JXQ27_07055 [Acidobacteria bacterium]|nr:hypothetical protein [Acidobacteriota bacterium]